MASGSPAAMPRRRATTEAIGSACTCGGSPGSPRLRDRTEVGLPGAGARAMDRLSPRGRSHVLELPRGLARA